MIWAAFHVIKVVSAWFFGKMSDSLPRTWLIIGGWAVYGVCYLAFGLASQQWQIWLLFVVYGSYYGLTAPAEKALMKDLAPAAIRGRAYGYYNFILGAAAIPAGLLTGFLWQTYSPLAALAVGAALAAGSSAALFVWSVRRVPR
jgi:MFS family permease